MLLKNHQFNKISLISNRFNLLKTKTISSINEFFKSEIILYNSNNTNNTNNANNDKSYINIENNYNKFFNNIELKNFDKINTVIDNTFDKPNHDTIDNILDDNLNNNKLITINNNNKLKINTIDSTTPLNTGKEKLVILGSGWGGARLARDIDCKNIYDLTIISSKNHMVFTPLLASSCVGTVHNQSVIENIRHIQPGLRAPENHFYLAYAENIDFDNNIIECVSSNNKKFHIGYDKLVIATGGTPLTFNIPGVDKYTYFLKNLDDSIKIRKKLLENICLAGIPNIKIEDRNKLLHFVIVGGGPTGVEFASELSNFINEDMSSYNPRIKTSAKITLIEGNEVLNSFDKKLSSYAIQKLIDAGVYIKKAQVSKINETNIELNDGSIMDYGMCVWSTGIGSTQFVDKLKLKKSKNGRIIVDDRLRVFNNDNTINNNVYALGDACINEKNPLPPLAQVAEQQGKHLAYYLNNIDLKNINKNNNDKFKYNHLGSMVSLTTGDGILEIGNSKKIKFTGLTSWITWRSAYLTKLQSSKNKINILSQWIGTYIKGREIGF